MNTGFAGWTARVDCARQTIFAFLIRCAVNRWAIFYRWIDAFTEEASVLSAGVVVRAITGLCTVTHCAVVDGRKDTTSRWVTGIHGAAIVVVAILGLVRTFLGAEAALAER